MSAESKEDGGNTAHADRIAQLVRAERLAVLYDMTLAPTAMGALFCGVAAWWLWPYLPQALLLGWLGARLLISVLRCLDVLHYRRRRPAPGADAPWMQRYLLLLALDALSWGVMGWTFRSPDLPELDGIILASMVGLGAISLFSLGFIWRAHLLFASLAFAPLLLHHLASNHRHGLFIATGLLIFLGVSVFEARRMQARHGELLRLRPAYMQALIAYRDSQGRAVYPDANSTLRVSYGKVSPLSPRDGMDYRPLTTVAGIVEKNTGVEPFDAPKPLLDAIAKGDFGTTADPALKTQTVDFMTNLDTTGGNSGSPVLDAEGKLIGLNFDSNWEAVSASWMFDPRYKRAIHVDMRYLRWLLAKVYPAPRLLKEMNLPAE